MYSRSSEPIHFERDCQAVMVPQGDTVTLPAGMENWFAPEFNPAKAGWKQGQMPIGQFFETPDDMLAAHRNDDCADQPANQRVG